MRHNVVDISPFYVTWISKCVYICIFQMDKTWNFIHKWIHQRTHQDLTKVNNYNMHYNYLLGLERTKFELNKMSLFNQPTKLRIWSSMFRKQETRQGNLLWQTYKGSDGDNVHICKFATSFLSPSSLHYHATIYLVDQMQQLKSWASQLNNSSHSYLSCRISYQWPKLHPVSK